MEIKIDNKTVITLNDTQFNVLRFTDTDDKIVTHISDRINRMINEKYLSSLDYLKKSWVTKLKAKGINLPYDEQELAELIFKQPDYLNCSQRNELSKKVQK